MLRSNGANASTKPRPRGAGALDGTGCANGRRSIGESTVTAPRTG